MPSLKTDFVDKTASPRIRYRLIALLSLDAFLLFKSAPFFPSDQPHPPSPDVHHTEDSTGQRVASTPPPASPPPHLNPWSSLTISEIVQIQDWLFAPEQALNLTQVEVAAPSDNHIFLVKIYYPPKQAVLDYLSSPSTVNPPPRFACVTLHHGAAQHPFVRNYLVGPLPIAPHTSMSPLTDIYQVDPIPYNARAWYINDWSSPEIYSNIAAPVAEAFKELFGGQAAGLPNDTLVAGGAGPFSYDGSFRHLWLSWCRSISGPFLHPLNFFQYIDISGTDTSQWKLLKLGNYHGKSTRPCYQLQGRPRCCGHCQLPLENDDESRSRDSSLV
ncbi:copper amine oxidase [Boletus edulis BED1]|uniref:Copper amine oxidase n=1 Tax=Boletus edulis BED1 TaxID=1328754 RepID=A0AAD4BFP0_BOLED|nr:copper amine oxidase [Boletus edulis BED1]